MKGISRRAFLTQSALGLSAMYLPKIGIFSSTNAFAAGADGTTLVVVSTTAKNAAVYSRCVQSDPGNWMNAIVSGKNMPIAGPI